MNRYVTYLADGTLDGCYLQAAVVAHAGRMIVVDEAIATEWVAYRANDARDGVELIPSLPVPSVAPVVPQEVSMRQARLALLGRGVLGHVDAAIDALPSPDRDAARIEWDYSSVVARNSPLVTMMCAALGLDDDARAELFITAARL